VSLTSHSDSLNVIHVHSLAVKPNQNSNEIIDQSASIYACKGHSCAAALNKGVSVAAKSPFHQGPEPLWMFVSVYDTGSHTSFGPWLNVRGQRYLGLKFVVNGKTHYGWARVKIDRPTDHMTLTGYAYETIPNKPIITGATKGPDETNLEEPEANLTTPIRNSPSLGLLALGAPGLSIWRREEATEALAH
jgi:hypothetical protein